MIIAEVSIVPLGIGTSVSQYVRRAVKVIESSGLKNVTGGMSTAIEAPDLDTLFGVIKDAEQAVLDSGAKRVVITLKIDDRRDKDATIDAKIKAATS
jgi:uncharacterized protein (TIGR00106 family)